MTDTATVADVLVAMHLQSPSILAFEFCRLPLPDPVERRADLSVPLLDLIDQARSLQKPGDSFTETMLSLAPDAGQVAGALSLATFHQPLGAATLSTQLPVSEASAARVRALCGGLSEREILVLTSQVGTTRGTMHIPMLDFKLHCTPAHDLVAVAVAERLGRGWLLSSGSSYHYYGATLLTETQLFEWLLRAQLMGKYVDTRWVTHQLLERKCALRVSQKPGGRMPSVIWSRL